MLGKRLYKMADEVSEQSEEMAASVTDASEQAEAPVEVADVQEAEAESGAAEVADSGAPEVAFSWQASEYVHHQKSVGWYLSLAGGVMVLMVAAALLKLWLYIGVFLVMGIAVSVYARKPPRTMTYELSSQGIHIDGKLYPFAAFRSFGVIPDEEWHSIDLEPTKRFSPRVILLFNTEDLDSIVGHLELHLPRADRQLDMIERLTRYLRF